MQRSPKSKVPQTVLRVLIAATLVTCNVRADTFVGGPILSDATWTASGSPYVVTAAIIIGNSAALTIEPGVTVRFNAGLAITVGAVPFGQGTLKAIGTADQKITFTSNVLPNLPGQWKDIFFTDFTADAVFDKNGDYVSGSILKHCIIRFAGSGDSNTGAVTINLSSPLIESCKIHDNARSGIRATNSAGEPVLRIRGCNMHDNVSFAPGGGAYLLGGHFEITDNVVQFNTGAGGGGLHVQLAASDSNVVVSGNVIADNQAVSPPPGVSSPGGGLSLFSGYPSSNSSLSLTNNTIRDNQATSNNGGGLYAVGGATFVFSNNVISGNWAGWDGGAVYLGAGPTTFVNNTVTSNTAFADGGGVYVVSNFNTSLVSNTVTGNTALRGGGLFLWYLIGPGCGPGGTVNAVSNTIADNQARLTTPGSGDGYGGGVFIGGCLGPFVDLCANTITGNIAAGGSTGGIGRGGGLYVDELVPSVDLAGDQGTNTFNVISGNTADFGEAIYNNRPFARDGSNNVPAQYVCWGGLDPAPLVNPNLIYDYYDDATRSFVLYHPHVTDPDCAAPRCDGDLDRDGAVGINDFLALLSAWGPCPPACPPSCPADLNGDGAVGINDFLALLGAWGPCPVVRPW